MNITKEFYLDLSNSDNNILDLSEYKGQRVKISIESEETNLQELFKLYGSVNWKDQEAVEYQRNSRNEW